MNVNGKLFLGSVAAVCFFAWAAIGFGTCTTGCAGGFDASGFAQDDAACVSNAKSREEADNCRAAVRAKYNLPQRGGK